MGNMVNTVTGPVAAEDLGKTLMHEHFIFGYPGFQGDTTLGPYDRNAYLQIGIEVAERAKAHGVKTVVDPTPNECGRDPELLREISERTGVQIVCATGYYYEGESATAYFKFRSAMGNVEDEIYEMYMKEITEGIGNTGIKAGIIKLASSKDQITPYEQMFFRAAARVQKETGITILTHTQEGTMGPQQAELLVSNGADPTRVMIGHMDGNTNVSYHLQTLQYGVNIGFDRFGLEGLVGTPHDVDRVAVLLGLIGLGYQNQIMLSHDTVNIWLGRPLHMPEAMQQMVANWHITHIFDNIIPKLKAAGISDETLHTLFVSNPAKTFGAEVLAEQKVS
ncbi:phosphotriesterase family protein [Effusibacillus dendaii]|uniref:Phosphotriesterase n=1 Tax=Effusibacillus dendaii TaxID=2743772 RepID=A0A7I8D871_9BACL|nr:phosphotriesterase-related protein [Effusibacillus dendaii]BCJ86353.1 phosphotriesterase [Effusibacillus dendaii]